MVCNAREPVAGVPDCAEFRLVIASFVTQWSIGIVGPTATGRPALRRFAEVRDEMSVTGPVSGVHDIVREPVAVAAPAKSLREAQTP